MPKPRRRAPRILARFLALIALCGTAPAWAVNDNSALWIGATLSGDFGDRDWSPWLYMAHTEYRRFDALEGTSLGVLRGGVGYRLERGWRAWVQADYRHAHSPVIGTFHERRLREMVQWAGPGWGDTTLRLRFLLEQRWIEERAGTGWRFRPRVRLDWPIEGRPGVNGIVFAETFHDLRNTEWVDRGWNEKRLFLGARLPLGRGVALETGYLAQWTDPFQTGDQLNHTLVAMFRYR